MIRIIAVILFLASSSQSVLGQAVEIPFVVSDGHESMTLYAGLDPAATSGIDPDIGEAELPPLPPHGIFDARFVGTNVNATIGHGSYRDYRTGDVGHVGEVYHELKWQIGSGPRVTLAYDLPANVSAHFYDGLDDSLVDRVVRGNGVLEIENPGLTQLRLTLRYGVTNEAPRFLSTPSVHAYVGERYEYPVRVEDPDGDPLTVSVSNAPSWISIEDNGDGTATLAGTPTSAGSFAVVIEAHDGTSGAQQSFQVAAIGRAMREARFTLRDGRDSLDIYAGIDPSATVSIDAFLGEQELPPFPPSGSFDARFIGTGVPASLGEGSYRDFRPGAASFEGDVEHRIRWQLGTGAVLTIAYELPSGVVGRIQDVVTGSVVDETIIGSGEISIDNANLTQARLTLSYTANTVAISARVMEGSSPLSGIQLNLIGPATDQLLSTDASGLVTFPGVAIGENYTVSVAGDASNFIPESFTLNNIQAPVDLVFVRTQAPIGSTVTLESIAQIGAEGGAVEFGSGGGLHIPAGAIAGDQSIIVGRFDEAPPGVTPAGPLFYFGPPGTSFSTPASITVPYDPAMIPAGVAEEDVQLVRFDESTGAFTVVEPSVVNTVDKTITAEISSFSGYGAAHSVSVNLETLSIGTFSIDGLYPNPASESVHISFSSDKPQTVAVTVFDALGRVVAAQSGARTSIGSNLLRIDVSVLPAGTYFVRLQVGSRSAVRPLTVMP